MITLYIAKYLKGKEDMLQENAKKTGISQRIEDKIRTAFRVDDLEIINDSVKHKGHAGDDGSGESHYTIVLRTKDFSGLGRIEKHRRIHEVLKDELRIIHALSLKVLD